MRIAAKITQRRLPDRAWGSSRLQEPIEGMAFEK
jgi:hypothetical protein